MIKGKLSRINVYGSNRKLNMSQELTHQYKRKGNSMCSQCKPTEVLLLPSYLLSDCLINI